MNEPTPPPESTPESAWSPVRPVRRDASLTPAASVPRVSAALPSGYGVEKWSERDLLAEAQVRGLAIWFYTVAVFQLLAAAVLGLAVKDGNTDVFDPDAALGLAGLSQPALIAPAVVLWFALAVRVVEERRFLALPVLVVSAAGGAIWIWGGAGLGGRVALSLGCCGGLALLLGLALWAYGPFARYVTAGWALFALYPAARLLLDGSPAWGLYAAIVPAVVLFTLFFPRTGKVFYDAYSTRAKRDPHPVPIYASVPLWIGVTWLAVPALALIQLLR